jgi:hypothetical protein
MNEERQNAKSPIKRYYKNESNFSIGQEEPPHEKRVEHSPENLRLSISGRNSFASNRK